MRERKRRKINRERKKKKASSLFWLCDDWILQKVAFLLALPLNYFPIESLLIWKVEQMVHLAAKAAAWRLVLVSLNTFFRVVNRIRVCVLIFIKFADGAGEIYKGWTDWKKIVFVFKIIDTAKKKKKKEKRKKKKKKEKEKKTDWFKLCFLRRILIFFSLKSKG